MEKQADAKIKAVPGGNPEPVTPDVLYRERLGKLIDLSDDAKRRLKKFLKKNLGKWEEDTADRRANLVADNDLVENVVEDTGWPYEGAPNIHMPITSVYMKIFKSVQKRSILGSGELWHAKLAPEAFGTPVEAIAPDIAEMMNYKAAHEWNIMEAVEDVFHPTNRDGLGILKTPFVETVEKQRDILIFTDIAEFAAQFPTAEAAGMDPEEYEKTLVSMRGASPESPVEIPVEFEKVVYSGPKSKVVELVDFVTFPANCRSLSHEDCRGYGELFMLRKGAVREKARSKAWDEEAVKRVLKSRAKSEDNELRKSQDEIEGLASGTNDEYRFLEIVVWFPLEKDGEEQKLLVTYSKDHDELMAVMEYPYRVDFYSLFRIEKRTNRLVGNSIPSQTRDINALIDKQITQRVLSREITTIPSFKGRKTAKGDFDPEAEENRWRPGVIFWLDDPDAFDQFKVQPTDLGESMQEEKNAMATLDLLLGSSASLLSGQASTSDPGAPGNKTAMMINQSNLRMDDPITTIRDGIDHLGEVCLSHLYQFGPPEIAYVTDAQGPTTVKTLHKKLLRSGIRMTMAGVNVVDNPQAEMQRWFGVYGQMVQEPLVAQNPEARLEILGLALRSGRVPNRQKILPTLEQVREQQVAIQMEAQKRLLLEAAVAKVKAKTEQVKGRFDAVDEDLKRRKIAERAVEAVAGGEDAPAGQ